MKLRSPVGDSDHARQAVQADGATLRDPARPFRFPARLIDRRPTRHDLAEDSLRRARGEKRPRPEPADPEELREAWSREFSAQARLTERQKNAIALMLAGEKEVRIARRVGVHRGTLWRWRRQDPDFRRALASARQRAFALAADQLRELVPRAIAIVQNEIDRNNYQAAVRVLRMARLDQPANAEAPDPPAPQRELEHLDRLVARAAALSNRPGPHRLTETTPNDPAHRGP